MDSNNNKATILTTMLSILLKEVSFFDKPLLDTLNPHLKSKRFWYLCVTVYLFFYLFLLIQSLTSLFKTLPTTRTRYILIFRSNLFFLHLIRRFWNQTRTCVSVRPSRAERRRLCCPEMYWSVMKTFSSSCSWWAEKTVRPLCGLVTLSSRAREELSSKRGEPVRKESKSFKNQLKPISLQKWISNARLDFLFFSFFSFFFFNIVVHVHPWMTWFLTREHEQINWSLFLVLRQLFRNRTIDFYQTFLWKINQWWHKAHL